MEITIKDKNIELKQTMRSIMVYEQITGKPFSPTTITDILIYFYSVLIASDTSLEMPFDEFMDFVDDNPEAFENFNKWLAKTHEKNSVTKQPTPSKKKRYYNNSND